MYQWVHAALFWGPLTMGTWDKLPLFPPHLPIGGTDVINSDCFPQTQWKGRYGGPQAKHRQRASLKAFLWRVNPYLSMGLRHLFLLILSLPSEGWQAACPLTQMELFYPAVCEWCMNPSLPWVAQPWLQGDSCMIVVRSGLLVVPLVFSAMLYIVD